MTEQPKRALLVIDVQNEYFSGKLPISYPVGSLDNIKLLMQNAHKRGLPIILVQHTSPQPDANTFVRNSDGWKLHPDILLLPFDCIIEKNLPGSFTDTNLGTCLKEMEVDTVVICGYMSQMCCDTTARQAMHLGYHVEYIADATGTLDIKNYAGQIKAEDLHHAVLITQAMRFSQVMNTGQWITEG
ncbi:MAG: cysteine hydrolase family protein [Methylocystaceae bacterium]